MKRKELGLKFSRQKIYIVEENPHKKRLFQCKI